MKYIIMISIFDFLGKHYIFKGREFDVKIRFLKKSGIFRDKFVLQVEGSEENIQKYLDYLKWVGFKIHYKKEVE